MLIIVISLGIGIKSYMNQRSFFSLTGHYLKASNGIDLIIDSGNMPIVMSNQTKNENLFSNLKSGDQIRIKIDAIAETYPGEAGVYACEKVEEGNMEDIPQEAINELVELGWLDESRDDSMGENSYN